MKLKKTKDLQFWLTIILALLIIIVIIIQISTSNQRQLSSLETSLFSILQFILSLSFAWLLAKISFRAEFISSQKQFAIAAFRRIKEIDMTVERVINRIVTQMKIKEDIVFNELDLILEIAKGIRQSIKSSIADWSDIIGDEIETLEKIESLNYEEEIIDANIKDELSNNVQNQKILEQLKENQNEVRKLIKTLPLSLQIATKKPRWRNLNHEILNREFKKQIEANGYIILTGFWDNTFEKDVLNFKIGDTLNVRQGDVAKRIGIMVAYDSLGESIGVIVNNSYRLNKKLNMDYPDYFTALIRFLGKSIFDIEITQIEKTNSESDRHYFEAKILV